MTPRHALLPAALALLLPASALGHDATVACDATSPNGYTVVADYGHLNPVSVFTDTTVTVTWADRYRVVLPLPTGCVVPVHPVVPPAPPAPERPVTPVVPVVGSRPAPPVVTPGEPETMPRKKAAPRKPVRVTCALLNSRRAGIREYTSRGWYFRCKAPVPPRKGRPYHPPVTG